MAKDVIERIHDQYAPADFMVLDKGEEEYDTPIILGRPFLNTTSMIIYVGLDKSTSNSLEKRYVVISIVIPLMNSPRRPALGGDVDLPNAGRINLQRMNGKKMKNLKKL